MATTALMTAEEHYALPDERRGELIRGGMLSVAAVGNPHWRLTGRLMGWVSTFVNERRLGEVGPAGGFILGRDPDTVLAPDLAFVRADRLPSLDVQGYLALAPDLAVEVISPSNSAAQIAEKVALYLEAGTRLVWVVDQPRRAVTTHAPGEVSRTLGTGETLDGGEVLPGFALPLADLFT